MSVTGIPLLEVEDLPRGLGRARHLPALLFLLTVLPTVALAVGVYRDQAAVGSERAAARVDEVARVREAWVQDHLTNLASQAALVSERPEVRRAAARAGEPVRSGQLEDLLASARTAAPGILGLELTDAAGARIAASGWAPSPGSPASEPRVLGDGVTMVVLRPHPEDTVLVVSLGRPVRSDGTADALRVMIHVSSATLVRGLATEDEASTLETLLGVRGVDGAEYFAGPRRFGGGGVWTRAESAHALPVQESLAGVEGVRTDLVDYRGVAVFAATRYVDAAGWGVVAKVDRSEAMAPVARLGRALLVGTLVVTWIVGVLALVLGTAVHGWLMDLRSSRERLARLTADAPFPMLLHAEDGQVLLVNGAWLALSGYTRDELASIDDWTERAYGQEKGTVRRDIERLYGAEGRTDEGTYFIRTAGGEERAWEFSSMPMGALPDGRRMVVSMAADVTRLRHSEQELRRQRSLYAALSSTNRSLAGSPDPAAVVEAACAAVAGIPGVRLAWIGLVGHEAPLTVAAFRGRPDALPTGAAARGVGPGLDRLDHGVALRAVRTGSFQIQAETADGSGGSECAAAFPIHADGRCRGALAVEVSGRDMLGPAERRLLGEIAADVGMALDNHRRAEELAAAAAALKRSEARFRRLAEHATDLIFRYDFLPEPRFSYVSPAALALTGYTPEEHYADPLLGRKLVHPEDAERLEALTRHPPPDGTPLELRWIRKDGSEVWTEQRNVYLRDAEGRLEAIEGIARDISAKKLTEKRRARSRRRLRRLVKNMDGAVYRCAYDPSWTMRFLSERILDVTGYPPRDFLGNRVRSYADVIHPADRGGVQEAVEAAVEERRPFRLKYRVVTAQGTVRRVVETGRAVFGRGRVRAIEGVIRDHTAEWRDRAVAGAHLDIGHLAREASEGELIRGGLAAAADVVSADLCAFLTAEASSPRTWGRTEGPEAIATWAGQVASVLERTDDDGSGAPELSPREAVNGDLRLEGTVNGMRTLAVPVNIDGSVAAWLVVGRGEYGFSEGDAAGLRAVGRSLWDSVLWRRQEERLRFLSTAVEQSPVSVVVTDREGDIVYVNPKFTQVSGYALKEVLGQNPRVLKSGETPDEEYARLWATISSGRDWSGVFHNRRKDGSLYWEQASISPIHDREGAPAGYVAVKEDITERVELEQQLRQKQKMEAVGRLAGGVAHDFNNLLLAILANAELLLDDLGDGPHRADVAEIKAVAERGGALTAQLLAFGRRQVLRAEPLDLGEVVDEFATLLRRLLPSSVTLVTDLAAGVPLVHADRGQLEQVIMNLVLNARDAMPDGGTITIRSLRGESDAEALVRLEVEDTGVGIAPELMPHLFEPFFTTKEVGSGTGLGLATVYGIMSQSGGSVSVRSEVGVGTVFTVSIPRARRGSRGRSASPAARRPRPVASGTAGAGRTILLVEDEAAVRTVCARILSRAGHRVLAAASPDEAVRLARAEGDAIDLILSDIVMPRLSGPELVGLLERSAPSARHLFMSGYSRDVASTGGAGLSASAGFLQKPFSVDDLLAAVRYALEGASAAS